MKGFLILLVYVAMPLITSAVLVFVAMGLGIKNEVAIVIVTAIIIGLLFYFLFRKK